MLGLHKTPVVRPGVHYKIRFWDSTSKNIIMRIYKKIGKTTGVRPVGASGGFSSGEKKHLNIITRIYKKICTFDVKTPVLDQ